MHCPLRLLFEDDFYFTRTWCPCGFYSRAACIRGNMIYLKLTPRHPSYLNCLFRISTINLLPRGGGHMLKFALMETNEPLSMISDEPHNPKTGKHFLSNRSGNENQCCSLLRVIGSVAGHFCTTTKVKVLCFATRNFAVSYLVSGVPPCTWYSRILVIFAVLLHVTMPVITYEYSY